MSFCADCITGVQHEGTPEGKYQKINGVKSYVATPGGDYPKHKVLIFLPDVFGFELVNARLVADSFAKNGIWTIIPDLFNGDAVPADALEPGKTFDLKEWFKSHGPDKTRPPIDKVIAWLKEKGITRFGTTGYCFGGRYAFDLSFENILHVTVVSHPSSLKSEDLEKYLDRSNAPLLINSCEIDPQFGKEIQAHADAVLGDGKFAPGYKREYFEGCTHGFAVRGDMSDPKVKAGKEGAFKAAVEWLVKYL